MTLNAVPHNRQFALAPLDEKAGHVRGWERSLSHEGYGAAEN